MTERTQTDLSGDDRAQKKVIMDALRIAYEPGPPESGSDHGWHVVAHLVMHWLKHPESIPKPPLDQPLRGLVFIEDDGTVRHATSRDL